MALGVILLAVLLLGGCGSQGAGPQRRATLPSSHGDPESIFEDELRLHTDPAGTLDALQQLGVDRVRVYVAWNSLAPAPDSPTRPTGFQSGDPAAYPAQSWSILDTIARDAAARGIGLDFTVGGPAPLWAAGAGAPRGTAYRAEWKPSAAEFGSFVRALGIRYDGRFQPAGATSALPRVNFWAIWNEPNYGPDLAPQTVQDSTVEVSPLLYRALLGAAWGGLQGSGHGGDTILIGETAPRGLTTAGFPGLFSGMVPLRFIRALYCIDGSFHPLRGAAATLRGCPSTAAGSQQFPRQNPALFHAGGFADHPYPSGGVPPNTTAPLEPDYADLPSLPNLERTLDRAVGAYGVAVRLPIYSTEFGYQTNPPETIARTTDPATAAIYLNWSEYISWRDPRIRSYDQYQLSDPPAAGALGGFATGLEFKNHVPKTTYEAYRLPLYLPLTSVRHGQSLEVWGCLRPAQIARRRTGRPPRVQLQFQSSSRGAFKTVQTLTIANPHGYFDTLAVFPSSGSVRLTSAGPGATVIHSRTVAVTVA